MNRVTLLCTCVVLGLSTLEAPAQNLQPESRQEFRRTFGFTSGSAPALPQAAAAAAPAVRGNLQPQSVEEFGRVFGQDVLEGTVKLQNMSTPSTINSTILNTLTTSNDKRKYLILWHLISLEITAIDHRANLAASPTTFHEQFGPARAARALALIHQAMFEAANAFDRKYASTLSGLGLPNGAGASQDAAIVEAAFQVTSWLYPGLGEQPVEAPSGVNGCLSTGFSLTLYYACSMKSLDGVGDAKRAAGIAIGRTIAGRIIADRTHDGAERPEPIFGNDFVPRRPPGDPNYPFVQWQRDPVSGFATALGGYWGDVKPFAMTSGFEFRPPESASPALHVPTVVADLPSFNAVRKWGRETRLDQSGIGQAPAAGDGFFVAQFWAYDGTANLCAPARLYNQIAAAVLDHIKANPADGYAGTIDVTSVTDVARYYALVNLAMADAAIAAWDAKYHFQFPRPVTYIRAADALTSPKPKTIWFPVGAQVTNSDSPFNITPPFPSYPSGHAVFGGALFGILRQFAKPESQFSFLSDEFNGKNKDVYNYVRCTDEDKRTPGGSKFCSNRTFTLNCAERENADSRVFMGVHWIFDADDGVSMGNEVSRKAYRHLMKPLDAQKHPIDPPSHTFSVANAATTRGELVCPSIQYPAGWDNADPKQGFGPLKILLVN